jgi:hypothetical protein
VRPDCAKELTTQHHLGLGYGFGPVSSAEAVLFAVFETTKREGDRLVATAFPARQLARGEVSVMRAAHTSKTEFCTNIVERLEASLGRLIGVARAEVGALRAIPYIFDDVKPPVTGNAVCVLDKVVQGDHDGHAALEYSESQEQLSPKQKNIVRQKINADIADAFGEIVSLDAASFLAPASSGWKQRIRSVFRSLLRIVKDVVLRIRRTDAT